MKARFTALMLAGLLSLSACSFDAYSLPLPGGPELGDNPTTLTIEFADVLDLVPDSTVKVGDVTVGKVESIKLDNGHADVKIAMRNNTKLPINSVATIRQTSLLGEKFVSLAPPESDPSATLLKSGDTITLPNSGRNPELEEVLGALSLVLNGGGVAQLQTIAVEINKALDGREDAAKSVLLQITDFMSQLDAKKADVVHAIEALDRLASSARSQEATIDATLEQLPAALDSIDSQRKDLVTMLQALSQLGKVGTRVIKASKASVIRLFKNLQPTLTQLANSGNHLVNAMDTTFTYPFVDEVVGRDPQVARNLHMGDYVNLNIDLQVDGSTPPDVTNPVPTTLPDPTACISSADLNSAACQDLVNFCQQPGNANTALCQLLNTIPGAPLPPIPGGGGLTLPPIPGPNGGILGSGGLGGLLGRISAAKGTRQNYRLADLAAAFNPSLVSLLVPGMAVKSASKGGAK